MANNFKDKFIKWKRIIRNGSAIVASSGQINPREEDITDDMICIIVKGGPFKILHAATQFKQNHR